MGKIEVIQKSRKAYTCSKCRKQIPAGSSYFKGSLNFSKPIVRCRECGLKPYEVTTSDYVRNVGRIVEDWQEDFEIVDGVWEEIASCLEEIKDEQQERLDNMPEHLQEESETGQLLQERIDSLEQAIDDLQSMSMDELLDDAYNTLSEENQQEIDQYGDSDSRAEWYQKYWDAGTEAAANWQDATEEAIADLIEEYLSGISY